MESEHTDLIMETESRDVVSVSEGDKTEAMQRIQAALVIAKRFPREEDRSITRILNSCSRTSLAEISLYAYRRGAQMVTGPTVRLAEVIAQSWGNLEWGMREIHSVPGSNGFTVLDTFCWDLESNVRQSRQITIRHQRKANKSMQALTDPRDVYEHVANFGQRRVRACILGIIPKDVIDKAVSKVQLTLTKGDTKTLEDHAKELVYLFSQIGVTKEMLEKFLKHEMKALSTEEVVSLRAVYNSIKDGEDSRDSFFKFNGKEDGIRSSELSEKLKDKPKEVKSEKPGDEFKDFEK